MNIKKQELCDIIEKLPEELSNKVLDYIEYLKYSAVIDNAPKNVIVKDKTDLRKKLLEGINDTDNGNVCTVDEVFEEVKASK